MIRRLAMAGLVAALAGCGDAERDEAGTVVEEGVLSPFELRVGDCFDDPPADGDVAELAGTRCDEPHGNEVYALFDLEVEAEDYPGEETVYRTGLEGCLDRFRGYVGTPYQDSVLDVFVLYPSAESWASQRDREVICALYHMEDQPLTGSMRDSGV